MTVNLASTLDRQRRSTTDAIIAVWDGWEGRNFHRVLLSPSRDAIVARGPSHTFHRGDKVLVIRSTRADGRSYTIVGHAPPEGAGASAYPPIISVAELAEVDLIAAVPAEIYAGVLTLVYIIGAGFTEDPLTTFSAYDPETSDPVAETWVADANATLGAHTWVDTASPPAALVGLLAPGNLVVSVEVTLAVAGTLSLRTT